MINISFNINIILILPYSKPLIKNVIQTQWDLLAFSIFFFKKRQMENANLVSWKILNDARLVAIESVRNNI